jgi:hypothetical protein
LAIPEEIGIGVITAFAAIVLLYGLAHYLQLAKFPKTKLKQQLYQSGETVTSRKRRYLERTFIWMSFFAAAHVISFMLATLLILTVVGVDPDSGGLKIQYPIVYFLFSAFAILLLARSQQPLS